MITCCDQTHVQIINNIWSSADDLCSVHLSDNHLLTKIVKIMARPWFQTFKVHIIYSKDCSIRIKSHCKIALCSRQVVARRPWLWDMWCNSFSDFLPAVWPARPGRPGRLAWCGRLGRQTQCWKGFLEIYIFVFWYTEYLFKHCQRHYGPRRWLLWPVILVW